MNDVKSFVLELSKESGTCENDKHCRARYHAVDVFHQEEFREVNYSVPLNKRVSRLSKYKREELKVEEVEYKS